ncbi:hypothetical protein SO802_023026 [Lithocarpus litseifolius]|uniref:Uncharacterized protein n=1 Tax=Lithocarpus litseifolius TaxID=425828 RepID=A0AAW2C5U7_9ROSI
MHSWKRLTFVYRPRVAASEVVSLKGVDAVDVVELVMAVQPSRNPSTRKGMSQVQKSHGLRVIGYCLTMAAGHHDARLMLVLDHPTPPVMRTLFQPRLCPMVLARTVRTLPVGGAQVARFYNLDAPVRDCNWHPIYPMIISSSWDGDIVKWEFPRSDKSSRSSAGISELALSSLFVG